MDDSPHASHWQQAAAAGEAFVVTATIAGALFVLFDRVARSPLLAPGAVGVDTSASCDDRAVAAVRDACLRAVAGGAQAAVKTIAPVAGIDAR
ncbi:MAG: hypothetical protein MUC32_08430 [Burkholderiaceae bacterium]|jgi:hypothetical protein|nr:hypothetical protein [Burkholderiaceae bacterium]MCU0928649.1 hypothetical protein [Burkholderiaceae bacterium]